MGTPQTRLCEIRIVIPNQVFNLITYNHRSPRLKRALLIPEMPLFIDEADSSVLLLVDSFRSLGGDAPANVNTIANNWQFRIDFHYFIGRFD